MLKEDFGSISLVRYLIIILFLIKISFFSTVDIHKNQLVAGRSMKALNLVTLETPVA